MGIDIYMRWKGQTKEEEEAQYTGFSVTAGEVGYLREAYHGAPYATQVLVPEAFESENAEAQIPAAVLRERLNRVIPTVLEREEKVYHKSPSLRSPVVKSFYDFVKLAEKKEAETGEPVTIVASY